MKNREIAIALIEKGITYEAVGKMLGISRQAVHQLVNDCVSNRRTFGKSTIYPNLLKWSIDHKCTRAEFVALMGFPVDSSSITKLHRVLTGKQIPNKDYIDKMLQATGLSYETMFEVLPDGD